ncbi:MAG: DUF1329 domain-containing protein [Thermodesulfobacteriota bacterium]|nr:DUF1329 domain-containing protein [Thermodesulfobacteriota bacterium]
MKVPGIRKCYSLLMVLIGLLVVVPYPVKVMGDEVAGVREVITGKANLPTIEQLTGGKVKKGDLIDKSNVDLVKEYLTPGILGSINMGLVLRMGTQLALNQQYPKAFAEATKKNMGKAVMDENGTAYYENIGVLWPGGVPFTNPKNGLEVMANVKFGWVTDTHRNYPNSFLLINSKGKVYKTIHNDQRFLKCTTRTCIPPFGSIPGYENILWMRISVMRGPLELKGLGQYSIRYYNDSKDYDTGFAYLPAFKRTIRTSATTWQDNMAGSDCTYGDGMGFLEPFKDWDFKLTESRFILLPEPKSPFPALDKKGKMDKRLEFDVGVKFPRFGWAIYPVHVVEAIPKIKHIYGKKMLYVLAWPYWAVITPIGISEMYDRQMNLWKYYCSYRGYHYYDGDDPYTGEWGLMMPDLQTDHMTHMWYLAKANTPDVHWKTDDFSFKKLLELGR